MNVSGKTMDGKRLGDVVDTLLQLPNVSVKEGNSHQLLFKYNGSPAYGAPGLCAVGKSTSYQRHIVPWVKKVTGYDTYAVNAAFQEGVWQPKG